jgi:hypothetical protein
MNNRSGMERDVRRREEYRKHNNGRNSEGR